MSNYPQIKRQAIILAGGLSSRMGSDKAQLKIDAKPLLLHHLQWLGAECDHILIAANQQKTALAEIAAKVENTPISFIDDALSGHQGPLSALLAGLQQCQTEYLWLMSCDHFGLPLSLYHQLSALLKQQQADIAYLRLDGKDQPLLAVLSSRLAPSLQQYLAAGKRSVMAWYSTLNTAVLSLDNTNGWANINYPDDIQRIKDSLSCS